MTSIRQRLLVLLLVGPMVILAVGGIAIYRVSARNLVTQLDASLEARAEGLAALVSREGNFIELELEIDAGATHAVTGAFSEFRSSAGDSLRRYGRLSSPWPRLEDVIESRTVYRDVELPGPEAGRAIWMAFEPQVDVNTTEPPDTENETPLAMLGPETEVLVVCTAVPRSSVDNAMATLAWVIGGVGVAVGLAIALLVWGGVSWGLYPLGSLTRRIDDVNGTTADPEQFDDTDAPRELVPVYHALNEMLDRVRSAVERERTFAGAAAHELRTPLAELRTTLEVATRWPDPASADNALREAAAIGEEMEQLVNSLLMISRGRAGASGRVDDVAVKPIVESCVARYEDLIAQRGLHVDVQLNGAVLRGTTDSVEVIVRNLVENAIRYTPEGGAVTITPVDDQGARGITVVNNPVTLTSEELPGLFTPFYRRPETAASVDGAGLGLAVVDQIVRASGLHLEARLKGRSLSMQVDDASEHSE